MSGSQIRTSGRLGVVSSATKVTIDPGSSVTRKTSASRLLSRSGAIPWLGVIAVMRDVAAGKEVNGQPVSVAQVALAWLLHQSVVSSVIIGAKRIDQLNDNIAAASLTFTEDELSALDEVSRLPAEYPGWMIERQGQYRA